MLPPKLRYKNENTPLSQSTKIKKVNVVVEKKNDSSSATNRISIENNEQFKSIAPTGSLPRKLDHHVRKPSSKQALLKNSSLDECDMSAFTSRLEQIKSEKEAADQYHQLDNGGQRVENVLNTSQNYIQPYNAMDQHGETKADIHDYSNNYYRSHTIGRRHLSASSAKKSAAFQRRTKSVEAVDGYRINNSILGSTIQEEPERLLGPFNKPSSMSADFIDRDCLPHHGNRPMLLKEQHNALKSQSIPIVNSHLYEFDSTNPNPVEENIWSESRSTVNINNNGSGVVKYRHLYLADEEDRSNIQLYGSLNESYGSSENYCPGSLDERTRMNSRSHGNIADNKRLQSRIFQSFDDYNPYSSRSIEEMHCDSGYDTNSTFTKNGSVVMPASYSQKSSQSILDYTYRNNSYPRYSHDVGNMPAFQEQQSNSENLMHFPYSQHSKFHEGYNQHQQYYSNQSNPSSNAEPKSYPDPYGSKKLHQYSSSNSPRRYTVNMTSVERVPDRQSVSARMYSLPTTSYIDYPNPFNIHTLPRQNKKSNSVKYTEYINQLPPISRYKVNKTSASEFQLPSENICLGNRENTRPEYIEDHIMTRNIQPKHVKAPAIVHDVVKSQYIENTFALHDINSEYTDPPSPAPNNTEPPKYINKPFTTQNTIPQYGDKAPTTRVTNPQALGQQQDSNLMKNRVEIDGLGPESIMKNRVKIERLEHEPMLKNRVEIDRLGTRGAPSSQVVEAAPPPVSILVRKDENQLGGVSSEVCHNSTNWRRDDYDTHPNSSFTTNSDNSGGYRSNRSSSKSQRKVTLVL